MDILVELAGQTANNRLGLIAMHAAPIQVHALLAGMAATSAHSCSRSQPMTCSIGNTPSQTHAKM